MIAFSQVQMILTFPIFLVKNPFIQNDNLFHSLEDKNIILAFSQMCLFVYDNRSVRNSPTIFMNNSCLFQVFV